MDTITLDSLKNNVNSQFLAPDLFKLDKILDLTALQSDAEDKAHLLVFAKFCKTTFLLDDLLCHPLYQEYSDNWDRHNNSESFDIGSRDPIKAKEDKERGKNGELVLLLLAPCNFGAELFIADPMPYCDVIRTEENTETGEPKKGEVKVILKGSEQSMRKAVDDMLNVDIPGRLCLNGKIRDRYDTCLTLDECYVLVFDKSVRTFSLWNVLTRDKTQHLRKK